MKFLIDTDPSNMLVDHAVGLVHHAMELGLRTGERLRMLTRNKDVIYVERKLAANGIDTYTVISEDI